MKIAVVKSSVYQDLWVTGITNSKYDLFKTSLMRCPPIGLAEEYGADFIIVNDLNEYPCSSNKNCLPDNLYKSIEYSTEKKNPSLPFLNETYHKHTSIHSVANDAYTINWSKYNIVMCINTCIPATIIRKYPNILWCYWVGENEEHLVMNKVDCYNIVLNQDVTRVKLPEFSIGFPYTYIGPTTIESIVKIHYNIENIQKTGIYMEINNTTERPVQTIPFEFLNISRESGHSIIKHSQDIMENAKNLYGSKYYIKLLGRKIRGNSSLECISAGTLLLADNDLITYADLILPECIIKSYTDAIAKIKFFDEHPLAYEEAIKKQRNLLDSLYFKKPYENLINKAKLMISQ
jgi:hypothetical protein